jgi:hypothetical protein
MRSRRLFSIVSSALLAASTLTVPAFAGTRPSAAQTVSTITVDTGDPGRLLDSPSPGVELTFQPEAARPTRVARPQWTPANLPPHRPLYYGFYESPLSRPSRSVAPAAGASGTGFGAVPYWSLSPVRPAYTFRRPAQTGYSYGWLPRSPLSFGFVPQSPLSYGRVLRPLNAYGRLGVSSFAGVRIPRRYGVLPALRPALR